MIAANRLPTEAEMVYATRAGGLTTHCFGETEELLPKYAWYLKNSKSCEMEKKHPEACKSQGDAEHIAISQPKASKNDSALQKAVHSIIFGPLDDDELELLALTLAAHRQGDIR